MHYQHFFQHLWQQYSDINPRSQQIHALFEAKGEIIINDHVAFRTVQSPQIGIAALEPHFFSMGYQRFDDYRFASKHLNARAYIHADRFAPKIFLSELCLTELSSAAQGIIQPCIGALSANCADKKSIFWSGRLWPKLALAEYQSLAEESDYAAWLMVHGFCANHFTIDVNALEHFPGIASVLDFVEKSGFPLNKVGGAQKGVPSDLLVQGSTLAGRVVVDFADGQAEVPACFYEFAERFEDQSGNVFQGFLAANADKIFESTHL